MNARALASALVDRGLDPAEAPAKAALFQRVLQLSQGVMTGGPACAWWVPGRLEVFGKHTDYAGGRTLVAAVPRGLALMAAPRDDGIVSVTDARTGERVVLGSSVAPTVCGGWRGYVEVVLRRLTRNFPDAVFSGEVVFAGDLPRASGMSSSSALVVGLATALARLASLHARPEWQSNVRNSMDAAGFYACIENGHDFGTLRGDAGVGTHGGSEDHTAILNAVAGHLSAFAFVPLRAGDIAKLPDAWRVVIASSGVTAEKTGSALGAYNRLSDGATALLALWNGEHSPVPSLAAALATGPSAGSEMRELIRQAPVAGWDPARLERRLRHFELEDGRVAEAVRAFQAEDAGALASLASASQADAETLLENQVPETIVLARRAIERGAIAASSFGAGFGGSVWAIVHRDDERGFPERWLQACGPRTPAQAVAFMAPPGPPLTDLLEPAV